MVVVRSQKGLSVFGWLMALVVIAFIGSAAMKIVPHYFDYMALKKMIEAVETDKAQGIQSVGDFKAYISKGMQINNMRDLDMDEALKIKIEGNEFLVHLKYEKREVLIENIDLVTRFDKEFRVRMP